ncbi:MAG: hypothetical protein JNK12_05410 [Acidimicrobiales bacterium]|nr:hypothetical protein [Acidimicrobiales bacterium]
MAKNVKIAVDDAKGQDRMSTQLGQAANDWSKEVARLRHEIAVAARLTGPAQKSALKRIRPQVNAVEQIGQRLIESAFTERLVDPTPLQHVSDSLDALDQAYLELAELEGTQLPRSTKKTMGIRRNRNG